MIRSNKKEQEDKKTVPYVEKSIDGFGAKREAIINSKMPEEQKKQYLASLDLVAPKTGVPFAVWAKIRGVPDERHASYLAYSPAKGVKVAQIAEWDEIFKNY